MTRELQSTLEASGIEWPVLRNHIPCMAHIIQLALGAFMSSLGVKGRTKSWEAHERDQQFGENESIDIGKGQRLRKEGNARINKVLAMRPGLARIIEKVCISWDFESPETDLHIAENCWCINYAETWSPKRVHWLSKSQCPHCCNSDYGWEDTLELYSGVARAHLLITGINMPVAWKPKIFWIPATIHNSGWMDDCEVCHGNIEAISKLDPLDVERHTVTLHHVITVYNDMFDHMDGVMRALAKKRTPWKQDLFFAVKLAGQKLSKYYAEVTPTPGMLLISAHILDHFRKLQSFRKWDTGMDIDPEDETSYTTQYQEAFLKHVENEYCAKHRRVPVDELETIPSSILVPPSTASGSYQSSIDPYDLASYDEEYLTPNNLAETTPWRSDCAVRLLTAARLYFEPPPEAPKKWGQINPNLNDYQPNPM